MFYHKMTSHYFFVLRLKLHSFCPQIIDSLAPFRQEEYLHSELNLLPHFEMITDLLVHIAFQLSPDSPKTVKLATLTSWCDM